MRQGWMNFCWVAGKRSLGRGFSLVELMTVVTIITIITLVSIANYHQGNLQMTLEMQANQFAQDLRRVARAKEI